MRRLLVVFLMLSCLPLFAQNQAKKTPTLKSILLEQLRTTHNEKDWFVDADTAMAGLTAEQAKWVDGKGNHSVGQLVNHMVFWNTDQLAKFKGEKPPKFSGDNNETFNNFDANRWNETVKQFDQVMADLEKFVENADDKQLNEWASNIAHIGTHNAYHIGQIVFVRKEQGSWNPDKGVK
ncbi:MAG TPA: DinB family protein [Terriglobales bacterium]|nr:DinB family protein [Terriglobales bacterium]